MSLSKYLAKLAGKGSAQEKLADSLGQRMRLEIASKFENLSPEMMGAGKPATEMRLKAMDSSIRKSDHPDLSHRQWNSALEQVQNKLDKQQDFGKWTSIGQPSSKDLLQDYHRKHRHYTDLRVKEGDIHRKIGDISNSLYADVVPKSLKEDRANIGKKLDLALDKRDRADSLWRWLWKTGMGEGSRPIKLRDHKSGITKESLEKWIKKNQG